jgi:hypothetical protein
VKHAGRIHAGDTEIQYQQFGPAGGLRVALRVLGILTWPLVLPMALVSRLSDFLFLTCSQWLALCRTRWAHRCATSSTSSR